MYKKIKDFIWVIFWINDWTDFYVVKKRVKFELRRFCTITAQVICSIFYLSFSTIKGNCTCNDCWGIIPQLSCVPAENWFLQLKYLASSFQSFLVPGLTVLPEFTLLGLNVSSWTGYEATWVAFQASVSLISAASWLTEDRLYFSSSEAEVMWSLSVTLSSILSILFWATWVWFIQLDHKNPTLYYVIICYLCNYFEK